MRAAFGTAEATCVEKQVCWACNELMRVMTRVTENSVSTIQFYRVFLKIYER